MNTHSLNKLYSQLTAKERLALMIAAGHRDDASERQRLAESAPRQHFAVSHHHDLATALLDVAHLHLLTLLDLAATYWQWWGLYGWTNLERLVPSVAGTDTGAAEHRADEEEARLHRLMRYHAFLFVTHVDGWRRFCADWPMEPAALLAYLPGWNMVERTEPPAREHAYSAEDAALFLWSETPVAEDSEEDSALTAVVTVEGLAAVWHTVMERQLAPENGKPKW
jgi:hypothetical protein